MSAESWQHASPCLRFATRLCCASKKQLLGLLHRIFGFQIGGGVASHAGCCYLLSHFNATTKTNTQLEAIARVFFDFLSPPRIIAKRLSCISVAIAKAMPGRNPPMKTAAVNMWRKSR